MNNSLFPNPYFKYEEEEKAIAIHTTLNIFFYKETRKHFNLSFKCFKLQCIKNVFFIPYKFIVNSEFSMFYKNL